MILEGLIDLHVHSAPDVRPRSCDDIGLATEARRVGARAVIIKSHHLPTADRALIAARVVPGVEVYGGLVLNEPVGGLNLAAVDVTLQLGGKIIWLPTLHAVRHRRFEGKSGGVPVVVDGAIVPAARAIFRRVAEADVILATGHQSPEEIRVIVGEAWHEGVRKILINHPEHRVVEMTLEQQRELRREWPVYFERCYAQPNGDGTYQSNFEANLRAMGELGSESTVLASDVGQIENPPWRKCWEQTFEFMSRHGVADAELRRVTAENPARLLGLAPKSAATGGPAGQIPV